MLRKQHGMVGDMLCSPDASYWPSVISLRYFEASARSAGDLVIKSGPQARADDSRDAVDKEGVTVVERSGIPCVEGFQISGASGGAERYEPSTDR